MPSTTALCDRPTPSEKLRGTDFAQLRGAIEGQLDRVIGGQPDPVAKIRGVGEAHRRGLPDSFARHPQRLPSRSPAPPGRPPALSLPSRPPCRRGAHSCPPPAGPAARRHHPAASGRPADPVICCRPMASATAAATFPGSNSSARSHEPDPIAEAIQAGGPRSRSPKRVLPAPPAPTMVTSRCCPASLSSSASSVWRPTKPATDGGRLSRTPGVRGSARCVRATAPGGGPVQSRPGDHGEPGL